MLHVRCVVEERYHVTLLNVVCWYRHYEGIAPDVRLVAILRPFDSWYSVANRARWGEDMARESRLR